MGILWQHWRWLALGLIGFSTLAWAQQAQLENVRIAAGADRTRVVFDLSAAVNPDVFLLQSPARLVVDLPDTRQANGDAGKWAGDGVIQRLRTGVRHGYDLRVVLDLDSAAVRRTSFTLPPQGKHGNRVVVDLYPRKQPLTLADVVNGKAADGPAAAHADDKRAQLAAEIAAAVQAGGGADAANDAKTDAASDANSGESTAVATADAGAVDKTNQDNKDDKARRVAYTPATPMQKIVVAVDAGHGGHDPGAIGPGGTMEKNVTLSMARKLAAMIDEQPNMRAVLTRKRDVYVGLRERVMRSRQAHADLFVSIHANSSVDDDPSGVSVFALSLDGATSEHARLLAERENATVSIGGVSLKQKNPNVASFMLDLAQSATIEASLDVAQRVLHNLDSFTTLLRPKVEQAAFVVLKSPDTPSILVETGFISNPKEEQALRSKAYQARVVRAILQGVKGYFASYRPGTMVAENLVHTVAPGDTLSDIAAAYHVSVSSLRETNALKGNMIRVGQQLRIPVDDSLQQVASLP